MRGPGIRLDLDVRRLWSCPACGSQRRLLGDVASPLCLCREGGVVMQLTADSRLLRRAERLTPLPVEKKPLPAGWRIPEIDQDNPTIPVPRPAPEPTPTPNPEPLPPPEPGPIPATNLVSQDIPVKEVADEFGADIDVPANNGE